VHVLHRVDLAARLAGVAKQLLDAALPISACSTSPTRTGALPMPPRVTEARVMRPLRIFLDQRRGPRRWRNRRGGAANSTNA